MRIAGGTIGLVASVLGVFAAALTLAVGGTLATFDAIEAERMARLGWSGVALSLICVVFAALALGRGGALYGALMAGCAILGAITCDLMVAACMALVLVGGLLVAADRSQPPTAVAGGRTALRPAPTSEAVGVSGVAAFPSPSQRSGTRPKRLYC